MEFNYLHDLHCHSILSSCCSDERMTPANIVKHAEEHNYSAVCLTDHMWDSDVPGVSGWYESQNIAHVKQSLPMPTSNKLRVLFGCETEYIGGDKLGLARNHFDEFQFVVIPATHMHMKGFVRPKYIDDETKMAELVVTRLEQLITLDLPFRKIGIAHLTLKIMFEEGDVTKIFMQMDEKRLMRVFDFLAKAGAGIELNAGCLAPYVENPEAWLRPYRFAKKAGCKFYSCSDAHAYEKLDIIEKVMPDIVRELSLTEDDRYIPPFEL